MAVTPEQMLDDAYLASRAKLINMHKAQDFAAGNPEDRHRKGGTIYLSAADESGMMVSFIQSNYMGLARAVWNLSSASACRTAATASALPRVSTRLHRANARFTPSFPPF